MKQHILLFVLLFVSNTLLGQTSEIVSDFYNWYLIAIKEQPLREYAPEIVRNPDGMTMLNFKQYNANLRKYHCSENMIMNELSSYQECQKQLANIKYERFQEDIEYDEIDCDFMNTYRWIYSQEPIDGVKIIKTQNIDLCKQLVIGQFYNINEETQQYSFWDKYCYVLLVKENDEWKIDNIEILDK